MDFKVYYTRAHTNTHTIWTLIFKFFLENNIFKYISNVRTHKHQKSTHHINNVNKCNVIIVFIYYKGD